MVAQHSNTPGEPPRSLSAEVEQRLERALRGLVADRSTAITEGLTDALKAAGSDARERNLRPEELILVFKTLEERIGVTRSDEETGPRSNFRARLIRALLEAYYH